MQEENLPGQGVEASDPASLDLRRQAADQLRPVLRALARVIASDRRAAALTSRKAEILLANRPAQALGLTRESLLERLDWSDLTARAKRAGSAPLVWDASGQSYQGEVVLVPLGQGDGFLLRLSESDQEATLLRNQARAAMLMRVAHDLRTPIQSLLAALPPLTGEASAKSEGEGQRFRRAAGLALDHISKVLAVIRGEQSASGAEPDEDFRLQDEVAHLVEMVEPIARARSAEVRLVSDLPPDLTLHGPLRFVRALCQNLIDNSVNHGGGRVDLSLSAQPLPRPLSEPEGPDLWRVRLQLADQGGGLPLAQKQRLAEALGLPMAETSAPLTAPDRRPSAGLNVLAHALRQLGGQIRIEDRGPDGAPLTAGSSQRVIGTLFTVTFTLPGAPQMLPSRPLPLSEGKVSLTGRTLLLVEDSPSSRDWLAHVLQSAGAEVIAVSSAPEALALLQREAFASSVDLVLTDVTLPRISGIELAHRLLKGDATAAQPWFGQVVGLTAHADDRIRKAGLEAGMSVVLEKPIQPLRLIQHLAEILEGSAALSSGPEAPTPADDVLDPEVTATLIDELGLAATLSFMQRALTEAVSVHEELASEGPGEDTARRLHAATGAAGLTGMILAERALRATEAAVEADSADLPQVTAALGRALGETRQTIANLPNNEAGSWTE